MRNYFVLIALLISACQTSPNFDPVSQDIPVIDPAHPPTIVELLVPTPKAKLTGLALLANGPGPHPTVLLLHGYPGNEKNLDLAQTLRRGGFNVVFFHYRGAWGSQGDYSLSGQAEDVRRVMDYLVASGERLRVDPQRISLVGHSMGGFTALRAGSQLPQVRCVVGLAAANLGTYADRDEQARQRFSDYTDQLFMLKGYNGAKALHEIQTNAEALNVHNYGPGLKNKSVLLITGAEDTVIPPSVQEDTARAYTNQVDVETLVIPGDHSFSTTRILLQHTVYGWLTSHCVDTP